MDCIGTAVLSKRLFIYFSGAQEKSNTGLIKIYRASIFSTALAILWQDISALRLPMAGDYLSQNDSMEQYIVPFCKHYDVASRKMIPPAQ